MTTADWMWIGFMGGFITAAWICPAADKLYKKWKEKRK